MPLLHKRAKRKQKRPPPAKVEKKAPIAKGFFGVQREKDDVFFVIPDSLLRRPMLVTTRFISTPAGAQVYGGELANSKMLTWERHNNQLLLRAEMFESLADSTQRIWKSVEASAENPIVAAFKNRRNARRFYLQTQAISHQGDRFLERRQSGDES